MRGKVATVSPTIVLTRITPAYAGKSNCRKDVGKGGLGSPPPMRGKVILAHDFRKTAGITPAYAGKSQAKQCSGMAQWDHPRLCGEKGTRLFAKIDPSGSPPPMRGKDTASLKRWGQSGITPAYAGKSFRKTAVRHAIKDHPRLCGEKFGISFNPFTYTGSPPPMRGKECPKIGLS